MNRPPMTLLLGLLAVVGYQHRDKIAEMLRGAGGAGGAGGAAGAPGGMAGGQGMAGQGGQGGMAGAQGGLGGLGGLLGGLSGALGGTSAGGLLSGGLGELVERFRQSGHGQAAESWVGHGPNQEIAPHQLEQAIGPDVLATLTQQTGLSREELLSRLSRDLPDAVDKYTPEGRLPADDAPSPGRS